MMVRVILPGYLQVCILELKQLLSKPPRAMNLTSLVFTSMHLVVVLPRLRALETEHLLGLKVLGQALVRLMAHLL